MTCIGSVWFSLSSSANLGEGPLLIGIVIGRDKTVPTLQKAYIGVATGGNQKADENLILERGNSFPLATAKLLIGL